MLNDLHLSNVGLAPEVHIDWAARTNLIAGDNGLGKIFLLDLAWGALTRTWAGAVALPAPSAKRATIGYSVTGAGKAAVAVSSTFRRSDESWPLKAMRPPMPGIVVYIRIDGGFSVWDPARNYWRTDPGRPAAYHFQAPQVWALGSDHTPRKHQSRCSRCVADPSSIGVSGRCPRMSIGSSSSSTTSASR